MGARGPARKPAAIKKLEGNPGQYPLPENRLTADGVPVRPEHVEEYGAEVWNRIVNAMPRGVYTATDIDLLAAYCVAANDLRRATQMLAIEGIVVWEPVFSKSGAHVGDKQKLNPWQTVSTAARSQLAQIGSRLGLDPVARDNIKMPEQKPISKFDGLVVVAGGKS